MGEGEGQERADPSGGGVQTNGWHDTSALSARGRNIGIHTTTVTRSDSQGDYQWISIDGHGKPVSRVQRMYN